MIRQNPDVNPLYDENFTLWKIIYDELISNGFSVHVEYKKESLRTLPHWIMRILW